MLSGLKASIEKKKRERTAPDIPSVNAANSSRGLVNSEQPAARAEDVSEIELKRLREALEAKAKRYKQLQEGETTVVPKGALVDFEQKLNRPLVLEEELIEDRRSDESRPLQGAMIPPPTDLYRDTGSQRKLNRAAINQAVDDILQELSTEATHSATGEGSPRRKARGKGEPES